MEGGQIPNADDRAVTVAAFASVTGGAARHFLFTNAVRCGVKELHQSWRWPCPGIGILIAREHQVALP